MAFKIERVKRTGTEKRKLKVKIRGQGKKMGNYHIYMELGLSGSSTGI